MLIDPSRTAGGARDRRRFLVEAGGVVLAGGALGALAPPSRAAGQPLSALGKTLQGDLVARGAPGYAQARLLYNTRFNGASPLAIAYCESATDVARALTFARTNALPLTGRSGGHSYGGYSTGNGLVIDVSRMQRVSLANGIATVGAGAQLIDIYTALASSGRTIPGGTCPTVGIAGLALGGGIGFSSRLHGTTSDSIAGLTLVDASGRIRTCSATENGDLFWACRGGGGGNFGIVTSFRFRTFPVSTVTTFELRWPWAEASRAVAAWQAFAPHAPDALFAVCTLRTTTGQGAEVRVEGQYFGSPTELKELLAPLRVGSVTGGSGVERPYLNAMLLWAGCSGDTQRQCHLLPTGTLPRAAFKATSDYASRPISTAGIGTLVTWVARRQAAGGVGAIVLDAYGGAINRVSAGATAFAHRNMLYSLQYYGGGGDAATLHWIAGFKQAMRPYVNGAAYVNYIDPRQPNWPKAYYGANYARLQSIKKTHDPSNVFRFAQSVRLPGH